MCRSWIVCTVVSLILGIPNVCCKKNIIFFDRWNINKPTPTATQLLNQPNPRLIDISFAALWVSNMAMCQQLKFISLAAASLFQTPHCPVFQNPWPLGDPIT